jgi:uncharacterized protein (TIGR02996 family)
VDLQHNLIRDAGVKAILSAPIGKHTSSLQLEYNKDGRKGGNCGVAAAGARVASCPRAVMTERDAFIAAIHAAPDDDGPRLMYADWLTEHGDPRGEFIRVQCELATARHGLRQLRTAGGRAGAVASVWANVARRVAVP